MIREQIFLPHNTAHLRGNAALEIQIENRGSGLYLCALANFQGGGLERMGFVVEEKLIGVEDLISIWERAHVREHMRTGQHETGAREDRLIDIQWGAERRKVFG